MLAALGACDVLVTGARHPDLGVTPAGLVGDWEPEDQAREGAEARGTIRVRPAGVDSLFRVDLISPGEETETYFLTLYPGRGAGDYWGLASREPAKRNAYYLFHLTLEGDHGVFSLPDRVRTHELLRSEDLAHRLEITEGMLRLETLNIQAPWPALLDALNGDERRILGKGYELKRAGPADTR
jgi:hypothetical protein